MTSGETKQQYASFEDWFNEIEYFSLRSERFFDDMKNCKNVDSHAIITWLRAAFESGRAT